MTTPEQRPEVVQVEQIDRDAAWAWEKYVRLRDSAPGTLVSIRDDAPITQAFSRHRIAAEKAALERAAQMVLSLQTLAHDGADLTGFGGQNRKLRQAAQHLLASHPERRSDNG